MIKSIAQKLGFKMSGESGYDEWMMNFHNFLKENAEFQRTCRKDEWQFPPNSSWIVFTDMVSHAVMSGQFAPRTNLHHFERQSRSSTEGANKSAAQEVQHHRVKVSDQSSV